MGSNRKATNGNPFPLLALPMRVISCNLTSGSLWVFILPEDEKTEGFECLGQVVGHLGDVFRYGPISALTETDELI